MQHYIWKCHNSCARYIPYSFLLRKRTKEINTVRNTTTRRMLDLAGSQPPSLLRRCQLSHPSSRGQAVRAELMHFHLLPPSHPTFCRVQLLQQPCKQVDLCIKILPYRWRTCIAQVKDHRTNNTCEMRLGNTEKYYFWI